MIESVIDECLELSPAELDDQVRALTLEIRKLQATLAGTLAVVGNRRDFEAEGHHSLHAYVRATVNCGRGEATRLVRRSRLVNEEPIIGDTWAAGHIGSDQADRLARASQHPRAGHAFRDVRDDLVADAEHLAYDDFQAVVARFETLADVDGALAEDRVNIEARSATVRAGSDGVFVAAQGGNALQAAEMQAVFEQAKQAEFVRDCDVRRQLHGDEAHAHALPRTAGQRSLDALHAIFMAYVTSPADGKRPEPIVNILFDARTAGETLHEHGFVDTPSVFTGEDVPLSQRRCETSRGQVVHPDLTLQAMLRGRVRRVVLDSKSVVIDMGRAQRLFTGNQREAARLTVATCSARGCSVPASLCDIDHLESWEHLGQTNPDNGGPMCGPHNRDKHRRKLRARRTATGRVRLIRDDGSVIKPVGERDPVWAEPDAFELCHTVSWEDYVRTRPKLAGLPDLGWTIHTTDAASLRRRCEARSGQRAPRSSAQ